MIPYFTPAQAELLAGASVRMIRFLRLDFASETVRLCDAAQAVHAGGHLWSGLGGWIQADAPPPTAGLDATPRRFTLSPGAHARLDLSGVLWSEAEVAERPVWEGVGLYLEDWSLVGDLATIYVGRMHRPELDYDQRTARVVLTCEGLFADRARPLDQLMSDRSQQARYPGDRGLAHLVPLRNKTVTWPAF
ncbi:hypothetical protein [Neomegalonema sp.]|uniref:hypothetical protein n=1 Tax=Neomegalonema sp. TaxID=2039713 RepID=UPI00261FFDB9|nr:hypothetical protein [Neomegalonema sp.]MDD2870241.1 hypothetical protein [Neomegalonema sp.]